MSPRADFRTLAASGPVHLIGVGGAGMLALAALLVRRGATVTGSDRSPERARALLGPLGVRVGPDDDPAQVRGAAVVVISAAVAEGHPELEAARAAGIPIVKRAVALGEWVNRGTVAAVAGTHGKTTTTTLLTHILAAADLDPVGLVGGTVPEWGGNVRPGGSELYVVEADEYDRSFHALTPDVAIVTNLEADHLDIYGTLEAVRESFEHFLAGVRQGGHVVVCADDPGASALASSVPGALTAYGLSAGAELRGVDVQASGTGVRARVFERGVDRGEVALGVPGLHNLRNALGAAAAARALGVEWPAIREGLARFRGVQRRFQRLGVARGVEVVDDYAHHPTEIREVLRAARTAVPEGGRLVALFQPHLYSRTRDFAAEFGAELAAADLAFVTDVYPARERPIQGVTGERVVEAGRAVGGEVRYHPDLATLGAAVVPLLRAGDLCITLGAGSIETTGEEILALLRGGAHG